MNFEEIGKLRRGDLIVRNEFCIKYISDVYIIEKIISGICYYNNIITNCNYAFEIDNLRHYKRFELNDFLTVRNEFDNLIKNFLLK